MELKLIVTVEMGGYIGRYEFTNPQEIIDKGVKLEEILGEPQTFTELPGALSAPEMTAELLKES